MGSPLGPLFANIFLSFHEHRQHISCHEDNYIIDRQSRACVACHCVPLRASLVGRPMNVPTFIKTGNEQENTEKLDTFYCLSLCASL